MNSITSLGMQSVNKIRKVTRAAILAVLLLPFGVALMGQLSHAQTVEAPFDADYTAFNLGAVPGVPGSLGGMVFQKFHPNWLLIGGDANDSDSAIYRIRVTRDSAGHITGFSGIATVFAEAPNIDGGLAYGPFVTLFFTRYDNNGVGQIRHGSGAPDKLIDLTPLGVGASVGALNFKSAGFLGKWRPKIVSYDENIWYEARIRWDGTGTFNIVSVDERVTLEGGLEGFIYVKKACPGFSKDSILIAEYDNSLVSAYEIDWRHDPVASTRRPFLSDSMGPEGATIDPITGDFLFSSFDDSVVYRIEGCKKKGIWYNSVR